MWSVEEFLDLGPIRSMPTRRALVRRVDRRTLILGSSQSLDPFDASALERVGGPVRRRSGGGAVLVTPEDPLWIDFWVPRADPLFDADVNRAFGWVGDTWMRALASLGSAELSVHDTKLVSTEWSPVVCFAGVGPGEVLAGRHKVVGLSQWRGKEGALFSSAAYRVWDPEEIVSFLALSEVERVEAAATLSMAARGVNDLLGQVLGGDTLVRAVLDELPEPASWGVIRT
jgi:lipoate-protein ligase A